MLRSFFALLVVSLGGTAHASVIAPLDEAGLVQKADTIAFGSVLHTRVVEHKGGFVTTQADVQVRQAVRGAKVGEVIVVEVPGGQIGRIVSDVAGSPKLAVGDMVLGFFVTSDGTKRPLGMSFGLLRVYQRGPELRVFRELDGLTLMEPQGPVSPLPYVVNDVPLDRYLKGVRATYDRLKARGEVRP